MQGSKQATAKSSARTANVNNNGSGPANSKKLANKKKPSEKATKANGKDETVDVKAPPPGFAPPAAASVSAPSQPPQHPHGFSDAQQRLLRHRALFVFRYLVGKAVDVELVDTSRYLGVLDCIDPDDFSIVLKHTQRTREPAGSNTDAAAVPFDSGSTVIFKRRQLAHMSADGVVNYAEGAFGIGGAAVGAPGLRTDTEISGRAHEHLYGRELETASSWLDPQLDSGELDDPRRRSSGKASWNQFEANEKLFGVISSFDENLYTTKLDKSKITSEKSREAERLAREIERETTGNFHLQEERGQQSQAQDGLDEEARYSSVDRKLGGPASRGPNAYVPPALRNATGPSSTIAPPQRVVSPRPIAPASVPPTHSVSAPAQTPASEPGPATQPRKPISFSEAVTGRPAATAAAPVGQPVTAPTAVVATTVEPVALPSAKAASPNKKDRRESPSKSKESKQAATKTEKKVTEGKSKDESKSAKSPAISNTKPASIASATTLVEPSAAPAKKGLNPNAREFKLSASAATFTPKFAAPATATSSPYRQPQGHFSPAGHMHPVPPHPGVPGVGYSPMPEEWMYDGMMLDESEYGAPAYMGYGVPMIPNPAMMQQPMYPPMMPQQNMRMMGGQRGHGGGYGYGQPGVYNQRGYYGHGGVPGAVAFPAGAGGIPVVAQPPLPPTPADIASEGVPQSPSRSASTPALDRKATNAKADAAPKK